MALEKVGILGCGAMGSGIAQVVLQGGYEVIVREMDQEALARGISNVNASLEKLVKKERLTQEQKTGLIKHLKGTLELEDLADCDLVIEAVFEDLETKNALFKVLDGCCRADTVFATNTSSLSVTRMAAETNRKERFAGLHFFYPAPVMPLVEIIKTISLAPEVLQELQTFAKNLKKFPIVAKDNAGFIVNLLLTPFLLDAIRAVGNSVAGVTDIDAGIKLGLGHPVGPLMLADMIGLNLICKAADTMFEEYKDLRYAPPPLLRKMVIMGYHGMKTGKGFYDWSDSKNPVPVQLDF